MLNNNEEIGVLPQHMHSQINEVKIEASHIQECIGHIKTEVYSQKPSYNNALRMPFGDDEDPDLDQSNEVPAILEEHEEIQEE